jgi:hypothetical protein
VLVEEQLAEPMIALPFGRGWPTHGRVYDPEPCGIQTAD